MEVSAKGLRVLITAGGSGIGRAIAECFDAEGARVHVCDVVGDCLEVLRRAARHR
jgi:NAD(P)-dependent dehydrogenase (short-subunit alcohol dehydrogenase family)